MRTSLDFILTARQVKLGMAMDHKHSYKKRLKGIGEKGMKQIKTRKK
jgi:hypothetical protein